MLGVQPEVSCCHAFLRLWVSDISQLQASVPGPSPSSERGLCLSPWRAPGTVYCGHDKIVFNRYSAGVLAVPAGAARLSKETCPHLSESLTGARPLLASIRHGTRPGTVSCKGYRAGTASTSAGFLQGLSGVPARVYNRDVSLLIVFFY